MIVVDASAVIAIMDREPGFEAVLDCLRTEPQRFMTPISALEVVMVLSRHHTDPVGEAEAFMTRALVLIHPIDAEQMRLAQQAFLAYGKGRHRARLNLSDCFSYAAAKVLDAPLLYVGNDFAHTDLKRA
ncbi:MAG TPA: type II toxin-antitoxin system VapC family toxin [Rhizomicrobium sp.]|nr:type II toxin-antitoxin system VapC family toxin [Rhizomicrobium sp.]